MHEAEGRSLGEVYINHSRAGKETTLGSRGIIFPVHCVVNNKK